MFVLTASPGGPGTPMPKPGSPGSPLVPLHPSSPGGPLLPSWPGWPCRHIRGGCTLQDPRWWPHWGIIFLLWCELFVSLKYRTTYESERFRNLTKCCFKQQHFLSEGIKTDNIYGMTRHSASFYVSGWLTGTPSFPWNPGTPIGPCTKRITALFAYNRFKEQHLVVKSWYCLLVAGMCSMWSLDM